MIHAKFLDEYKDWVKQALFEVEDLRASVEFDEEFMGDALIFLDPSKVKLKSYKVILLIIDMNFLVKH